MNNICPVCGFALPYAAADFHICPSCGTEFGYDDAGRTHAELREAWLRNGALWWSPLAPAPAEWNPYRQVSAILERPAVFNRPLFIGNQLQRLLNPPGNQSTGAETPIYGEQSQQYASAAGLR